MLFTPLEMLAGCSAVAPVAELHSGLIPAGSDAPLGFESQRLHKNGRLGVKATLYTLLDTEQERCLGASVKL